jgi:hypothetical protein
MQVELDPGHDRDFDRLLADAKKDSVNFTLAEVQKQGTTFLLDGDLQPAMEIKDDPGQTLYRLLDGSGKPSLRARAYFRGVYRYATRERFHLGQPELHMLVDYAAEAAFKGGRRVARPTLEKQGDYNFEAVVAFANFLTDPAQARDEKGISNQLLEGLTAGVAATLRPVIGADRTADTLTAILRTADLWKAVESDAIAAHVHASRATLYKAVNFFSRRLAELEVQFASVGLSVTVSHRDTGSWVTIVRKNAAFLPDATVLVRADDGRPSASAAPSAVKPQGNKAVEATDDNAIARDPAPTPAA